MNVITIRTHLESDTIRIPELAPLVGKDVEITVREEAAVSRGNLRDFFEAAKNPPVDLNAVAELREISKI